MQVRENEGLLGVPRGETLRLQHHLRRLRLRQCLWSAFPAETRCRLGQREVRRHSEREMSRGDQGVFGGCLLSLSEEEKVISCRGRESADRFCDLLSEQERPHTQSSHHGLFEKTWSLMWRVIY